MSELQNGIKQEIEMVEYLNGKCFKDLNNNLKTMISRMFGIVKDDDVITATFI